jgi:hypothetical protein
MSEISWQILAKFESLPPQEQHELLAEMLRRSTELPTQPLSDDQLLALADERLQMLDAEEELSGDESGAK